MCRFCGDTVCFVQRLGTILTVGGAVRASLPIAIQHSHLVLGSRYSLTYMSVISDNTRPRPSIIIGRWNS
jgi:hypothetical protein